MNAKLSENINEMFKNLYIAENRWNYFEKTPRDYHQNALGNRISNNFPTSCDRVRIVYGGQTGGKTVSWPMYGARDSCVRSRRQSRSEYKRVT